MTEEKKKKQATEETDTVQRLLEFLNLNSTPGVLNLFKVYYFKFPDYPPLKHPPTKPPRKYDKDGFASVKEYLWCKGQDGKPIFIGKISDYLPHLEDFIKYFGSVSVYSFRYYKPEQLEKLYNIWDSLVRRFSDIAQANTQKERDDAYSKLKDFLRERQEDYKKGFDMSEKELAGKVLLYESYKTISFGKTVKPDTTWEIQEINTLILDFWTKHWKLLPRLKQCKLCGTFFIRKSEKEKRLFCIKKCKTVFHLPPKQVGNEAVRVLRQSNKEDQQSEDYKEMVKWLKSKGYTPDEAKTEAYKWIFRYNKSFKEYKRTKGRMYGIS